MSYRADFVILDKAPLFGFHTLDNLEMAVQFIDDDNSNFWSQLPIETEKHVNQNLMQRTLGAQIKDEKIV